MAAKTDSEIESDDEFEDLLAEPGRGAWNSFTFPVLLFSQFCKDRLDRVNELILVLRHSLDHKQNFYPNNVRDWIGILTAATFEFMPAEGFSDSLRLILRHFGETISQCQIKNAVLLAVFHRDTGSLQFLREKFGDAFIEKSIKDVRHDSASSCSSRLLWASEHDDIADFKGFLTPVFEVKDFPDRPDEHFWLCTRTCMDIIEKIAWHGRVDLVEALLADLQSKLWDAGTQTLDMDWACQKVLQVAIRRSNFALASRMLSAVRISWNQRDTPAIFAMLISHCGVYTVEFLEHFLLWVRASSAKDGHQMNPLWFGKLLFNAIQLRKPSHVEMLLDEIDKLRNLFEVFSWFLDAVLRYKSTAILRIVLLRYPEASIKDKRCDPSNVLREHHWTVGARLLVEAGATTKGKIPPEHGELFRLSLEDRCRIVARRNVKRPLERNVRQLPLPVKVKHRFLYQ